MDEKFQDRIDEYLLGRMSDADKVTFLQEVKQDKEKKAQLEFTKNVKDAIDSREEKRKAMLMFQKQYEAERNVVAMRPTGTECAAPHNSSSVDAAASKHHKNRKWLWISSIAAILVVGFFVVKPMFDVGSSHNTPMEQMRGSDDDVFCPAPADSTDNDTIKVEKEKPVAPNE